MSKTNRSIPRTWRYAQIATTEAQFQCCCTRKNQEKNFHDCLSISLFASLWDLLDSLVQQVTTWSQDLYASKRILMSTILSSNSPCVSGNVFLCSSHFLHARVPTEIDNRWVFADSDAARISFAVARPVKMDIHSTPSKCRVWRRCGWRRSRWNRSLGMKCIRASTRRQMWDSVRYFELRALVAGVSGVCAVVVEDDEGGVMILLGLGRYSECFFTNESRKNVLRSI